MHHPGTPFIFRNCILIFSLIIFWGCSSPAPVQDSSSDPTSTSGNPKSAEQTSDLSPGEGLWLMTQLQSPQLPLPADTIYHPNDPSLSNAVLNIFIDDNSRGSGAFVSDRGLVLTNYRTGINGIAGQSSRNQNYLHDGFLAKNAEQEIPLPNYKLRLLLKQKDITETINTQLGDSLSYREKQKQVEQLKNDLIAQQKEGYNNIEVEINDAWSGNRYIMSTYKQIDDVRLVHAPKKAHAFPHQDTFNQSWPSQAADYTFLRAYVAPSGLTRTYDRSNVPFKPQQHLQIDTSEITENDLTLALGYPQKTQRQESSYATTFYRDHRNPVLIDSYQAILNAARQAAQNDSAAAIANAPLRMSATQNLTYFRQLQNAIQNDSIPTQKAEIEQQFSEWVKEDSLRNLTYRRVLSQLDQAYSIAAQNGSTLFALVNTINDSQILQMAGIYHSYREHISDTTNPALTQTDKQQLLNRHKSILDGTDTESQTQLLADMLFLLSSLPEGSIPFHLLELFETLEREPLQKEIDAYLNKQQDVSLVFDLEKARSFLQLPADSVQNHPTDALVILYQELLDSYQFSRQNYSQHVPYLQPAQERYIEGLQKFRSHIFPYPDANGTLRLTTGTVKKIEVPKNSDHSAVTISNNKIANFLSTNDITGGGYGSPVLNIDGKLIGLTSYRTPEGIGSDFKFSPNLHRTINVAIGHIINQMSEFSGSQILFEEMHIQKEDNSTQK